MEAQISTSELAITIENCTEKAWHLAAVLISIGRPSSPAELAEKCSLFPASIVLVKFLCIIPSSPLFLTKNDLVLLSASAFRVFGEFSAVSAPKVQSDVFDAAISFNRFRGGDMARTYFRKRKNFESEVAPFVKKRAIMRSVEGNEREKECFSSKCKIILDLKAQPLDIPERVALGNFSDNAATRSVPVSNIGLLEYHSKNDDYEEYESKLNTPHEDGFFFVERRVRFRSVEGTELEKEKFGANNGTDQQMSNYPEFESYTVEEEEGSGPHTNAHVHHLKNEHSMLQRFGGKNSMIKYEGSLKNGNDDCFVLEHVDHDWPEALKRKIDINQLQWYGFCLFKALTSLHKQGVFHRDVKPGNFLFSCKTENVYLIDSNLAKDLHQKPGSLGKVEYTRKHKADLHLAALGNRTSVSLAHDTLEEQLSSVKPTLGDLRLKKRPRVEDFSKTESQITCISAEMAWNAQLINKAEPQVNEDDLTTRSLSERKSHLKELQTEKALHLQNIHNHITSICELSMVKSLDFETTVADIHPGLVDSGHGQSESISSDTLAKVSGVAKSLKQEKEHSLQKMPSLNGLKGKVKEVGYDVVEVGGFAKLEEVMWGANHCNVKPNDHKEEDHPKNNKEEHKDEDKVDIDDDEHKAKAHKDMIEVFVRVVDGTHMAEVRVGALSRQQCRQLHNFAQLKALVEPLTRGSVFSPVDSHMCCQRWTNQEYMDLPTCYKDMIAITDRILVREKEAREKEARAKKGINETIAAAQVEKCIKAT